MSLKTAGIREFARMIGRSHSWVVSQCQRNIIPKTTDGKIPVDEALKAVARLFAAVVLGMMLRWHCETTQ